MAKTSEPVLGLAVMQVLSTQPGGEATVRILVRNVPSYVKLTADDLKQSDTRPHEKMWEQRVRNLKSHDTVQGNVIAEGLVAHLGRGRYGLTRAGWTHLKSKNLA